MKKILQSVSAGSLEVVRVPAPSAVGANVIIESRISLISAGTERMIIEFGKAMRLDKVRQQPDKVRLALDRMRTEAW